MEISGRGIKLTAHLNLAPRSRVHGAISPLTHRPSYIVQELYLSFTLYGTLCHSLFCKLHHGRYYVCLYLQYFVATVFLLEIICVQNYNNLFVVSLTKCRISGDDPTGDKDGWPGLSQTLHEIPYNLLTR